MFLTLNLEYISLVIFFLYFLSCLVLEILSLLWNKFNMQRQNIEYPLNIHLRYPRVF